MDEIDKLKADVNKLERSSVDCFPLRINLVIAEQLARIADALERMEHKQPQ
jgi:hypothetical protein